LPLEREASKPRRTGIFHVGRPGAAGPPARLRRRPPVPPERSIAPTGPRIRRCRPRARRIGAPRGRTRAPV